MMIRQSKIPSALSTLKSICSTLSEFASVAADTNINLVLADTDPDGQPTSGNPSKKLESSGNRPS